MDKTYILGNVYDDDGRRKVQEEWSFGVIERVFDCVKNALGLNAESYGFYGHSAGSQFVHRFLYFMPENRAHLIVAANAGWYTMPTFEQVFP